MVVFNMREQSEWIVRVHRKVQKSYNTLPKTVQQQVAALLLEIRFRGPIRGNWKNYSKLGKNKHHCHIKSGHPTFVCCWQTTSEEKVIEVYYVGTHENAPY